MGVAGRVIVVVTEVKTIESPVGVGCAFEVAEIEGSSSSQSPSRSSLGELTVELEASSQSSSPLGSLSPVLEPSGPPCTPAASNLAFASLGTSQTRLVPGLLTSGRAKQDVPEAQEVRSHLEDVHWANCELIQAIWPSVLIS